MIYLLIPVDGEHKAESIRLFGTYAMLETIMRRGAQSRLILGRTAQWCIAIGYEIGDEEARPIFVFSLNEHGDMKREPFTL